MFKVLSSDYLLLPTTAELSNWRPLSLGLSRKIGLCTLGGRRILTMYLGFCHVIIALVAIPSSTVAAPKHPSHHGPLLRYRQPAQGQ